MKKIDEDPVFGKLVAGTAVKIYDRNIAGPVGCRHAHKFTGGVAVKFGQPKNPPK